jgi:biopolymer transport protein ExbB
MDFLAQQAGEGMNYFKILIWPGGGGIGVILWCLSFVLLAVIIQNILAIRRQNVLPMGVEQQIRGFLEAKQYREAIESTTQGQDYLSFIMHAALLEAPHGFGAMERAMGEAAEERTAKMLRYTEWLNLLGNLGPMIGLLGTVWGLILTFFKIVEKGGIPEAGELAGAIGVKLVCTLLGLCIAIPALGVYGTMRNRIDTMTAEAQAVGRDMLGILRRAKKPE